MRIKRNTLKEGERKKVFLWLPVFNEEEILWLEFANYYWQSSSLGDVFHYYEKID